MPAETPYMSFVMTMERIAKRLRRVAAALDAAGIDYAVVGGNAVALWVAKVDPAATRTTKDVDLLFNREDLDRICAAMSQLGFVREDLRSLVLFVDPEEPSRRSGVHVVWAGERVRPSYPHPAPGLEEAIFDRSEGLRVLSLAALVRMKLTSLRDIDRVHVADLMRVGLIDEDLERTLPLDLKTRLQGIRLTLDDEL